MKRILFIFLFFFGLQALHLQAQTSRVSGSVKDSVNFRPMAFSSAVLLRAKDSVMVRHVWIDESDAFVFNQLPADTYVLQLTRPSYADYEDKFILQEGETKDLGNIFLVSKSNLLREVIIRERAAIRIKGDTTEFLVDSFLSNKNANVEDLLKKLPGIQVDRDGKITAQGQEVKKVLVDGEEFFGDDPTIATRNLRAENVEKVQVFDKKSDQAAFSGIDDGVKEKTINLQLKEDAKKGYFGKASAGVGTQQRFEHDAMANVFKNKRKLSAYGAMSNTNKTRMSWDDANKYGGGNDNNYEYDESSGFMYSYGSYDNMNFDGIGVPRTWYTGIFFSDKVMDDRHIYSFNANKKDLTTTGYDNNYSKYILPDTVYYINQLKDVRSHRWQNAFSGSYEWKVDSFTTIKARSALKSGEIFSLAITNSQNLNENNELVFNNIRTNSNTSNQYSFNNSFHYNRKFRTTGRSLMVQLTFNQSSVNSDGYVQSLVDLYDTSRTIISSTSIDQKKTASSKNDTYGAKFSYTEPLSKVLFVVTDYDLTTTLSSSFRTTMAKSNGEYNTFVDSLSNDLKYTVLVNKGGLALRYVKKKLNISAGGRISYTDMRQEGVNGSLILNQSRYFLNLFPSASFNYRIKSTSSMNFGYNGSTRQPSIQQIQPIQDNSNPLDVYVGNPDLEQSFSNSFNFFYNSYKPISGQSFYTNFGYTFTNNDFASFDQLDEFGRKIHKTVNVNGNNSFWGYANYYFAIKKWHLRFGTNVNPYIRTNVNFINGMRNVNRSQDLSFGQNVSYEIEKKIDISLNADWSYNQGTSSLRPDIKTIYWIQSYSLHTELFLPYKFSIKASASVNLRQKTNDFDRSVNTTLLNGGIYKKFLKSESLEAGVYVFDLLNQNLGFDRNVSSNYVNERIYSVLKQYVLFTLKWNFTKGPVEQDDD